MNGDRDYVLGTHDEEIERLGLQHRVWRPKATDAERDPRSLMVTPGVIEIIAVKRA